MKKSQQIIGLPIISISDGNEVGKVKNIIINSEKGTIDYFVVDSGIQALSTRVIPTTNVLGIGEYAMTILNPEAISDISKIPAAIDLLQKNITVKETKVLTKKGSLIGETGDIFIDVDNGCLIVGIEYIADITQKKVRIIPRSSVITYGKSLLVVEDDVHDKLCDDPSSLAERIGLDFSASTADVAGYTEGSQTGLEEEYISNDFWQEPQKQVTEESAYTISGGAQQEAEKTETRSSAAELFEERQRQYLRGRKATRLITDNIGNTIINAGETITDEIIDRAKQSGKLVELVMNNEA
ncbi:MAG TPA: hypothetical protein DCE11_03205 [Ruminiclostridium sp.]|nr:hypothetical protein [Clostridiaceae bacterium]HAA25116.1 hypothetical protein [Ruminiclostridium sp.]